MKILCLTPLKHIDDAWQILSDVGELSYYPYATESDARALISDTNPDVIYVNPNRMGYRLVGDMLNPALKYVCTASTGTDHIDLSVCEARSVQVISLKTDMETLWRISSTAEMAFALMLALVRNIPRSFDSVKKYEWDYEPYMGHQLQDKSIGIVGYGRLGKMMAEYCKGFRMDVLLCDPILSSSLSLDSIFEQSEIVSLHVHLDDGTRHMIDSSLLSRCRGLFLINTSRGAIVDEDDVISALESGQLAGYATDVVEAELTDIKQCKLIEASSRLNIVITPHLGGSTHEGQEIAYTRVAQRLQDLIRRKS